MKTDQTARVHMLICVFPEHTFPKVLYPVLYLTFINYMIFISSKWADLGLYIKCVVVET